MFKACFRLMDTSLSVQIGASAPFTGNKKTGERDCACVTCEVSTWAQSNGSLRAQAARQPQNGFSPHQGWTLETALNFLEGIWGYWHIMHLQAAHCPYFGPLGISRRLCLRLAVCT